MIAETGARAEMLRRVREANGGSSTEQTARVEWSALPRGYKRRGTLAKMAVLELFEDRLRDYDAEVLRCEPADVARSVAARLAARGRRRMVVPPGLPAEWLPDGFEFVVDQGLSGTVLDEFDGALTGSAVAIAETGTVVLQHGAGLNVRPGSGQGRRAMTLVPDYHLCLVRVEDVVETVPEAMERLRGTAGLASTFVSGPSATADIEMTRIQGVHGPRILDVVLIACDSR